MVIIHVFRKILKILTPEQKKFIPILLVLMVVGSFLEVLGVTLVIPLLQACMDPAFMSKYEIIQKILRAFHADSPNDFILILIIMMIFLYVIKNVYLIMETNIQNKFVFSARLNIQEEAFGIYLKKPYAYFLTASTGEIMSVVNEDVFGSFTLLSMLLTLATEMIVSVALVVTVFIISPQITSIVAIAMVVSLLVLVKFVRPSMVLASNKRMQGKVDNNKCIMQAITGIKELKITATESYFEKLFSESGTKRIDAECQNAIFAAIPKMIIEMVCMSAALIAFGIMILSGQSMETLIPIVSAFAMAAVRLLPSTSRIATSINQITFFMPSVDKLLNHMEKLRTERDANQTAKSKNSVQLDVIQKIELKNIHFAYDDSGKVVLSDVSATILSGNSVGIVGVSGAGKTTFVDIMFGLLQPQEGEVLINSVPLNECYESWLEKVGYIPQTIFLLDASIRENVIFGRNRNLTDDEVWRTLREAQIADFVEGLPEGLDTQVGERGVRLSGGQRQRIGIARALYGDPEVLVFDEATSALDNETEDALMRAIHSLQGKKTMIIIAHRLTTIEGCDTIYRVENGKVMRER